MHEFIRRKIFAQILAEFIILNNRPHALSSHLFFKIAKYDFDHF